jgi:hypothetical protein
VRAIAIVGTILCALGCDAERRAPKPEVALSTDDWPPSPPVPRELPPDEPFDVRLVRLDPATHVDEERVCDVTWSGRLTRVGASDAVRYPMPIARRRLVRCRAETGEGWADLVFDSDSASLASYVDAGDRIRVRVLEGRGFQRHPILAFVATIDDVDLAPRQEREVPVGAPFVALAQGGGLSQVHPCALDYVGGIEPTDRASEDTGDDDDGDLVNVPDSRETHRVQVRCRHAEGADWLELRFPAVTRMAALRLERGVVIPVRLLSADGGEAGLPHGRYEGP